MDELTVMQMRKSKGICEDYIFLQEPSKVHLNSFKKENKTTLVTRCRLTATGDNGYFVFFFYINPNNLNSFIISLTNSLTECCLV